MEKGYLHMLIPLITKSRLSFEEAAWLLYRAFRFGCPRCQLMFCLLHTGLPPNKQGLEKSMAIKNDWPTSCSDNGAQGSLEIPRHVLVGYDYTSVPGSLIFLL